VSDPAAIPIARQELLSRLFPAGLPTLWCPLLTHYDAEGRIDTHRIAAQLHHLSPWVNGYLVSGSTGDGWEMGQGEVQQVLELVLGLAPQLGLSLLVGVLKPDAATAQQALRSLTAWLMTRSGIDDVEACLRKRRVCGFTVCPPAGRDLTQAALTQALASMLAEEVPIALYQLPQVTLNEMSPALVHELASRFPNLILFKDSSGQDRVACAGSPPAGVGLLRGAEGDYVRWLKAAGGPYDGLLLSTANCFAKELHHLIRDLNAGRQEDAEAMSRRLTGTVREVFEAVRSLPSGNAFAHANKALDHFFAHGPKARITAAPRLRGGGLLAPEVIRATAVALKRYDLMPERGYLE
jgi:dihydrodipicolinate synthase/N-acetylneuraminate lyase